MLGQWANNVCEPGIHETLTQCFFNPCHHLRRWPNFETSSGQRLVFAGEVVKQ